MIELNNANRARHLESDDVDTRSFLLGYLRAELDRQIQEKASARSWRKTYAAEQVALLESVLDIVRLSTGTELLFPPV